MVSEQFLLLILCGDHPRLILVSHNLIGNNYNTWSKAMAMTLTSKNKIGFIDGTIPRAAQADILFNAWNRYNNMVTSWIINSISKDIADSLIFKVLWEELKNFQPLPVVIVETRGQILMMEPLSPLSKVLLRLMLILGIQLQRENMRDLNVAIVDCRVIPLIVVTNCMDTHLGPYAGQMIGMGRRSGNLYVLDLANLFPTLARTSGLCNNVSKTDHELWHIRLGHSSYAMRADLHALEENGTWSLTTLLNGKQAVGFAKWYTQQEDVDYIDTFSPIAKLVTVKLLLALATIHGWFLVQLDVNNAFLHGDLTEEVYMSLPQGGESFLALLVYVDDIVIADNDYRTIEKLKTFLDNQFKLKDLGQLKYFLVLKFPVGQGLYFSIASSIHDSFPIGILADSCPAGAL
ncbi:Retrovirus-related Pol polyprotein from transposon TNT 1-94 [Vitis vinifera]|uniref:Retrovirus-related Pol polyprotein from transposon TNT 1-94 n=1 Tax=Vitis vinifera TaxID=29760 RepID=A0A438KDJ1_VITVI|nr:Retrovirus-related Pol polyprotein from transposon TNT 1-94 [Vitis vinifera]